MHLKILLTNLKDEKRPNSKILKLEKSYCVIGRKNADLILDEPRCSKKHAVLYQAYDGSLHVRDMGSTNGTFVNNTKIIDNPIQDGDEIRIGKCFLSILEYHSVHSAQELASIVVTPERSLSNTHTKAQSKKTDREITSQPGLKRVPNSATLNNSFIYFVDEEGTESKLELNELVKEGSDMENQGRPRKY